jgi:AcrR family transcriptional regulator
MPETKRLEQLPQIGGLDDSPRGRVMRAAAHLFRKNGYASTTVRELAQLVGIQSGSLFHHFKSKDDILLAVMEEAICYNTARLEQAVQQSSGTLNQIRALIRAELESINGDTGVAMAVLVFEWDALSKDRQDYLLNMREYYERIWLNVLERAQEEGLIKHPPMIWRRLIGGAISWTVTWYKPEGRMTLDQLADIIMHMGKAEST